MSANLGTILTAMITPFDAQGAVDEDAAVRLLARMSPRDPAEAHRAATPLELFFDLTSEARSDSPPA